METEAPVETDAPVETEAPVATDAPVETEAPVATDPPGIVGLSSENFEVAQEHDEDVLDDVGLFDVFPDAFSAIIVSGDFPEDCNFVAVLDANGDGDGLLGPGDEAVFGVGIPIGDGTVAIPIDRGGEYFVIKDESGSFPVGVLGDDATVDGTSITVGGTTYETVAVAPDGSRPAVYDVDFGAPVMPAR